MNGCHKEGSCLLLSDMAAAGGSLAGGLGIFESTDEATYPVSTAQHGLMQA